MERRGGYTLVEAVATLVLIGILAAVAMTRLSGMDPHLDTEAELLRSRLRYAQSMAMANNVATWTVTVTAGGYALIKDGVAGPKLPGENSNAYSFPAGITASPSTITLDDFGTPGASDVTITLAGNAGRTVSIAMLGGTGFMQ